MKSPLAAHWTVLGFVGWRHYTRAMKEKEKKRLTGATIGGAAGGLIGAIVGGPIGALIGAAVAAAVGHEIGKNS
jgi:uncharacterized protein YcfJ